MLLLGLLVDSMSAANQEISPELQSLAMKDLRFKKGQTRNKGGVSLPGRAGGKQRVSLSPSLLQVSVYRSESMPKGTFTGASLP